MKLRGLRVPLGVGLLAGLLALAGWLDYRATSRELHALRRSEADTLYETIAAAARVQHKAAQAAETALGERLLDHARLLAATDRRRPLDAETISSIVADTGPFRVMVLDAAGRREFLAGDSPQGQAPRSGPGGGRAGPGQGAGRGRGLHAGPGPGNGGGPYGPPAGASRVAERLLGGDVDELVSEAHAARAGGERIAAGVRRANGGAIIVNAANKLAGELESVYSLDALLSQIADATPALAYVILQDQRGRVERGPLASAVPAEFSPATAMSGPELVQNVLVFERRGRVALDDTAGTELRIGMRLDDVQRAERRALLRVAGGLGAIGTLLVVGIAFGGLRQRYGALSVRHEHAQEALRRRDRLTAMGEMASTVAHEIRNPLNAIAMSAQRLAREYPKGSTDEAAELVDVIQGEASRINGRVQQFLEFARPRPLNAREIGVPEVLAEVAAAAAPLAGTRAVGIDVRPAPAITMRADADQLRQAIDNLVRNAIDATPAGGTITLSAERRGRNVAIEVRDTGAGISPDVLPHIFDLYFTTKREGTGVGLAVVQQIASAHGGTVSVDSTPGVGTRMMLELPQQGEARG